MNCIMDYIWRPSNFKECRAWFRENEYDMEFWGKLLDDIEADGTLWFHDSV